MTLESTTLYDRILLRMLRVINKRAYERILKNEIISRLPNSLKRAEIVNQLYEEEWGNWR